MCIKIYLSHYSFLYIFNNFIQFSFFRTALTYNVQIYMRNMYIQHRSILVTSRLISSSYGNIFNSVFISFIAISNREKKINVCSPYISAVSLTKGVTCLFAVAFRRSRFVTLFDTRRWSRDIVPGAFKCNTKQLCHSNRLTNKMLPIPLKDTLTCMHSCKSFIRQGNLQTRRKSLMKINLQWRSMLLNCLWYYLL